MLALRKVVFTNVQWQSDRELQFSQGSDINVSVTVFTSYVSIVLLIVGRLHVDSQRFAPIGLHKTDAASDLLLIKCHCIGTKGLLYWESSYKINWIT
jgi:hypothetical protein